MALTIVTLQFHYGGCFVSDPTLRYVNGITSVEKINIDVDELHIMLFHKITLELGAKNVETFGCRVNKNGTFYMLNIDSDVLNFLNGLKGADFVDVYVVHPISISLVVEEILVLPSTNADVSSSPQTNNVDVSSSQPFDENENRHLNQNQSPLVEEQSPRVEEQALDPRVEEHSDSDSLDDIDENIDDLKQVKEKADRVNLDEIPSCPVGIDVGFEDIYKEKRGRFEGNLGGDDPYFDSSDPGSDISEDEWDPVENDEVGDSAPRKESTKIYFDPTAKKSLQVFAFFGTNLLTSNVLSLEQIFASCFGSLLTSNFTNAAIGSQLSVNASPSAGCTRSAGPSARRPTNASSSGVRPATALASGRRPTTSQKRKTSTTLRGGTTLAYNRPRQKKKKQKQLVMVSYLDQSGNTDRVLHSAILSSSTPTNIDLGYKPNGLRWKGRTAITQRQLRKESYRSTQGTQGTQGTH
ncbi:hypothetical protein R3W88_031325 [Solanum pinnatisectum]|uniref:PB1-like domain-containing protein n=1 Tax=Solanum pinnatisectum TaxID=50273 RepID=A0AAV9LLM9_9SOLN|nr:hypothetical protein R3W88_031325 [Solanum pinnatisectum]